MIIKTNNFARWPRDLKDHYNKLPSAEFSDERQKFYKFINFILTKHPYSASYVIEKRYGIYLDPQYDPWFDER